MYRLILIILFLAIQEGMVMAVEEAGHGETLSGWIWKIVNFAILVFILVKFLGKPMREYFRKRTETIEKSLKEAQEAKEIAQKALQEVQEKLKLKDEEIKKIISSARRSGEAEKTALVKEGEEMSKKIKEQAKTNIDIEIEKAKALLRQEASELAVNLAEKRLKETLTDEDKAKLIEEAIKRLSGERKN